jgi:hypothetical protein
MKDNTIFPVTICPDISGELYALLSAHLETTNTTMDEFVNSALTTLLKAQTNVA